MTKSGLADSPFFRTPPPNREAGTALESRPAEPSAISPSDSESLGDPKSSDESVEKGQRNHDTVIPRHRDTMTPRHHGAAAPRDHGTTLPRIYGVPIEIVRKAVKEFGKEAATHRFTVNEKKQVADLIYTYKRRGIRTSENEIARIAINFIVEDYRENGQNSVLHRILEALNE